MPNGRESVESVCHTLDDKYARRLMKALRAVRQFLEQAVPVGDVFRLLGLQSPQKHPCRPYVVSASIQRCNHLALKHDVLLCALHEVFGHLQLAL
jgi:hypothetical protein